VLVPSEQRLAAPCPYFGVCGGCHYQHAPYAFQVEQKVAILREVIRRVGKFEAPADIGVVAGEPWAYRNRTQLHVADRKVGYLQLGTHQLCPISHCPISSPKLNEAIAAMLSAVQDRRWPRFIDRVEFFTNEQEVQFNVLGTEKPLARHFFDWIAERIPGYAAGAIEYSVGGDVFQVGPRSFFQVNRFLTEQLVAAALEGVEGDTGWDLYAGVGLFSLPLRRRLQRVTAVESNASALADLAANAGRADLEILKERTAVDQFLRMQGTAPDFVLADPPREGLGKASIQELRRLRPRRLHIVACDPATLARDLRSLLESGYRLERLTLVDLFPQTYHLETVAACVL
jgi:23S rRNA (uracil1939-C5)-methyltransferase